MAQWSRSSRGSVVKEQLLLSGQGVAVAQWSRSSRSSVVKETDLCPVSLSLVPSGTHTSHWWWQKGHPTKIFPVSLSLSILMAIFPGGPGLAGTIMSPFWIWLELRMTVVVVTTGAIRCVSSSQSPPTSQYPAFYRLSTNQGTEGKTKIAPVFWWESTTLNADVKILMYGK